MKWQGQIAILAVGMLGISLLGTRMVWQSPHFRVCADEEARNRITDGMSEVEVEEVLGGPPGDYTTGPYNIALGGIMGNGATHSREWLTDEGGIVVYFDEMDLVVATRFNWITRVDHSLWNPWERCHMLMR
jgi:hypothetical protein